MKNRKLFRILLSVAALFLFLVATLHFLHSGFADSLGWTWLILGLLFAALAIIDIRKQGN